MAFCNIRERRNQVSNHLHTICRVDLPPRDKTVYDCEASRDYKRNQMRLSCDALQHGYLLQTIKGYNLDTVEFWNSSARNILRTLSRFQEASFTLIHSEATEHNDCSWTAGLRFQASEMMKKEVDLSEKMKNILSKREKRYACSSYCCFASYRRRKG